VKRTGQRLLKFDRKLGARFVAGADEAGRGSLAGPLVVAGVLLDYSALKEHRVRPLAYLNDSKQCSEERRQELFHAVIGCAEKVVVRAIPASDIDRNGLHRSNLAGLRAMLQALAPPAEACLVDGFRLGPLATRRVRRSRPRRSSRKSHATGSCAGSTRSIPRTASPSTSATSRRDTPRSCASVVRARCIA
jgi:ribonuclease HII